MVLITAPPQKHLTGVPITNHNHMTNQKQPVRRYGTLPRNYIKATQEFTWYYNVVEVARFALFGLIGFAFLHSLGLPDALAHLLH